MNCVYNLIKHKKTKEDNKINTMKSFVFCLCILGIMYATARGQKVEGYIYDAQTNEPLVGVNVTYQLKGETKGGASYINGFYEIVVPAGGIELAFSFVGYESQLLPLVANLGQELKRMYI